MISRKTALQAIKIAISFRRQKDPQAAAWRYPHEDQKNAERIARAMGFDGCEPEHMIPAREFLARATKVISEIEAESLEVAK